MTCMPDRHRINARAEREIRGSGVTTEEAGAVTEHSLIAARDYRFPAPVLTSIKRPPRRQEHPRGRDLRPTCTGPTCPLRPRLAISRRGIAHGARNAWLA